MNEPIRRRKAESVIRDLHRAAKHLEMEDRRDTLWHAGWNAARLADQLVARPDLLGELLGGLRAVRDSGGPGAQIAERQMHQALWAAADGADAALSEAGAPRLGPEQVTQAPAELRPMYDVLALLAGYAMDSLHLGRQRDSYGGERREKAMELLGMVYRQVELPGMADLLVDLWKRTDRSSEEAFNLFFEFCGEDQADLLNAELDRRLGRRNPGPCQLD